jgi:two-component system chemotaxis response regulator CheY
LAAADTFGAREVAMAVHRSMAVLVVEDMPIMSELVASVAKRVGFTDVDQVPGAKAALAHLRAKPYGLVISDFEMDEMTGVELLREVRQDEELKDLPFIMITAHRTAKHILSARRAGANSILIKPFSPRRLREKILEIYAREWKM